MVNVVDGGGVKVSDVAASEVVFETCRGSLGDRGDSGMASLLLGDGSMPL